MAIDWGKTFGGGSKGSSGGSSGGGSGIDWGSVFSSSKEPDYWANARANNFDFNKLRIQQDNRKQQDLQSAIMNIAGASGGPTQNTIVNKNPYMDVAGVRRAPLPNTPAPQPQSVVFNRDPNIFGIGRGDYRNAQQVSLGSDLYNTFGKPIYDQANKVYNTFAPSYKFLANAVAGRPVYDTSVQAIRNQENQGYIGADLLNRNQNGKKTSLSQAIGETVQAGKKMGTTGLELAPYAVGGVEGGLLKQAAFNAGIGGLNELSGMAQGQKFTWGDLGKNVGLAVGQGLIVHGLHTTISGGKGGQFLNELSRANEGTAVGKVMDKYGVPVPDGIKTELQSKIAATTSKNEIKNILMDAANRQHAEVLGLPAPADRTALPSGERNMAQLNSGQPENPRLGMNGVQTPGGAVIPDHPIAYAPDIVVPNSKSYTKLTDAIQKIDQQLSDFKEGRPTDLTPEAARQLQVNRSLLEEKLTGRPASSEATPPEAPAPQMDTAPQRPAERSQVYADNYTGPLTTPKAPEPNVQPTAVSGTEKIGANEATKPGGIFDQIKQKASTAYTKVIDRYNPLINAGKQAGERKAVENALAGHYGATSTANYHIDYELKPIFDSLPKGASVDDFKGLLIAQRDAELAARGIKGSDATVAGATLDKLKAKLGDERFAQLQESAQQLYNYQKGIVEEYLVKPGIISRDAADAMFAQNQAYIPFQRVLDNVDGVVGQSQAAGSVGSQNLIKGIKGSDKQIKDPIESIIENTYRAVAIGKRNETASVLTSLADKLPEGTITRVTKEVPGGNYISVFENGKKVSYAVPKEVAESAKALNAEQMNTLVKILAAPARVFRATATEINPEFILPNVTRDLQQAFVTAGVSPVGFVKGLYHYLRKDDMYQAFLKSGGMTSRVSLDPKSLRKTAAEITGTGGIQAANPKRLYSLLEEVGSASEQPTRIAAFQKTLKKELKAGVPVEEALKTAGRSAQESSTNFARRGEATQAANAMYAFMNARVQGTDKLIRSIKENPAGAGTRLGMITVAPAVALYAYNRQFENYYDPRVVSDYDKENNFIIMAPFLGEDKFIKIPKGDVGRLANPVEASLEYLDRKKTGKDIADTALKSLSAFSPVQNFGDAIPTGLRPGVEGATNYNFFTGRQIVPEYKKNYPASQQFNANTPAIYRQIGEQLGLSPAQIQNMVEGYTTGIGKMTAQYLSKFSPQQYQEGSQPKGDPINQLPIARRFLGGAKQSKEEYSTQLARQINGLEYAKTDLKAGLNRKDLTQAQYDKSVRQIEKEQNDIRAKAKVDGYASQLESALRQMEDAKKQKTKDTRAKNKKR